MYTHVLFTDCKEAMFIHFVKIKPRKQDTWIRKQIYI